MEAVLPQHMLTIRIKFIFKGRNTRITLRGDYFPGTIVHVREDETMNREFNLPSFSTERETNATRMRRYMGWMVSYLNQ